MFSEAKWEGAGLSATSATIGNTEVNVKKSCGTYDRVYMKERISSSEPLSYLFMTITV